MKFIINPILIFICSLIGCSNEETKLALKNQVESYCQTYSERAVKDLLNESLVSSHLTTSKLWDFSKVVGNIFHPSQGIHSVYGCEFQTPSKSGSVSFLLIKEAHVASYQRKPYQGIQFTKGVKTISLDYDTYYVVAKFLKIEGESIR